MRSIAPACFVLSALLMASAQDSLPAAKPSSIAGVIVKEPGSEPLKKVLVQVVAENQKEGGNYAATTDADGHFQIENVVPGRYRVFFERTGFVEVNSRGLKVDVNVFTIRAGQALQGLLFRMLPTAVITGRITDEDGDPMSEVRVVAQKKRPGKAVRGTMATVATNDLGEYRLPGLFPGQYWIMAIPPPDFRDYEQQPEKSPKNENTSATQPEARYLTTYYPATYDAMQASPVTLKSGDEMPVNLTLVPARTYRVRGIVAGVTPNQKTLVELVSKGGLSMQSSQVGPDSQFEVRGVGPGSYVIRASSSTDTQSLTARQDLSVVAADVEGVKLTPQPSFTLFGHLRIEGAADLTQYSALLRPAEPPDDTTSFLSQELSATNAAIDRFGNLAWKNVSPDSYLIQVYGGDAQGSFLKSATLNGADILTGFTASGSATIELVMSSKGGTVEGVVVEKEKDVDDGHPVAGATVVAVPEERYRKIPDRFAIGSTDQSGAFTIHGMAPGNYTLYAWQDAGDGIWRDPDFLKSQEANGTAVKVEEGSTQRLELKISAVAAEWR